MSSLDPSVIRAWVYVLRLAGDRYYVGVSKELNRRLEEHWSGAGSRWTKEYPPVDVETLHRCEGSGADVTALEKKVTLELMRRCITPDDPEGWRRVRGGPYTKLDMCKPRDL